MIENLKFCRELLDITQEELGNILGVSRFTVSGWENNHDSMPLEKLIKFCNIYDYSINYVMGLANTNIKYNKIEKIDAKEIGNSIKNTRKKLKISQKNFANKCGYNATTLCNYESGYRLLNSMFLYSICKTYNLSADELLGRKKSNTTSIRIFIFLYLFLFL